MKLTQAQLETLPVFGIAGNFAEHLSQAGEDADFVKVKTDDVNAPKGIFPIYLPGTERFLNVFPLSSDTIQADFSQIENLQMEPEVCLLLNVTYQQNKISGLTPKAFTAFNDCSIRRPNARKISEKKNWGTACTGIGDQWIEINSLASGDKLDNYHILSLIRRDGEVLAYGVDSPTVGYQYFHEKLLNWMIKTLNTQQDFGPLEPLHRYLADMKYPREIIITLGATRYTAFGETGYLKPGDELGIYVYDANRLKTDDIHAHFTQQVDSAFEAGCFLHQWVKNAENA